jgi:hypothetical protein
MTNRDNSRICKILEQRQVIEDALAAASERLEMAAERSGCEPDDADDLHSELIDSLYRFDVEAISIEPATAEYIAAWREYHCGQDIAEVREAGADRLLNAS